MDTEAGRQAGRQADSNKPCCRGVLQEIDLKDQYKNFILK
jgi:hypothetical protein